MAKQKHITLHTLEMEDDAMQLFILFEGIAELSKNIECELADRAEYLAVAVRAMAERGAALATELSERVVTKGKLHGRNRGKLPAVV